MKKLLLSLALVAGVAVAHEEVTEVATPVVVPVAEAATSAAPVENTEVAVVAPEIEHVVQIAACADCPTEIVEIIKA